MIRRSHCFRTPPNQIEVLNSASWNRVCPVSKKKVAFNHKMFPKYSTIKSHPLKMTKYRCPRSRRSMINWFNNKKHNMKKSHRKNLNKKNPNPKRSKKKRKRKLNWNHWEQIATSWICRFCRVPRKLKLLRKLMNKKNWVKSNLILYSKTHRLWKYKSGKNRNRLRKSSKWRNVPAKSFLWPIFVRCKRKKR